MDNSSMVGKTFVWHEINCPDAAAAKKFYTEALGWGSQDMDMGEHGTYTMFTVEGTPVAGVMPTGAPGMPPIPTHWSTYIAVDDVDARAQKIVELGGELVVPGFDIPGIGRTALVKDPQGATFYLFRGE